MPGQLDSPLRRLEAPSGRFYGRLLVAFLASLGLWYALRAPYTRSLLTASEPLVARALELGPSRAFKLDGGTLVVNTGIPSPRGAGRMVSLRNEGIHLAGWTALVLWMLILATPLSRLKRFWMRALAAAAAVWALQVLNFTLEILQQVGELRHERGVPFASPRAFELLVLTAQYLKAAGPILPFVFFLPVLLGDLSTRASEPSVRVARNALCPCASGRKYKRCCGAVAGVAT